MSYSCPLSYQKIDVHISRFTSLLVSLLVFAYFFTHSIFILFFLVFDYFIRLYLKPSYSLVSLFARFIKKGVGLEDSFIDGGAKKVANHFGLFFVLLLLVTHLLDQWILSLFVGFVLLFCSLLDFFFGFCIGCQIYYLYKKIAKRLS